MAVMSGFQGGVSTPFTSASGIVEFEVGTPVTELLHSARTCCQKFQAAEAEVSSTVAERGRSCTGEGARHQVGTRLPTTPTCLTVANQ